MHTLVYGGTFDPIHLGHLITCRRARELLGADRVLFIPARVSPHKTDVESAAAEHRAAMLRVAIAGDSHFALDPRELESAGPNYTFDTLAALQRDFTQEQFTLLIGADQLPRLHTWHRVDELLAITGVGILGRGSTDMVSVFAGIAGHFAPAVLERLRGSVLATPLIEISATDIRTRVAAGLPIDFLTPPAVVDYIHKHHLYRPINV